MNRTAKIYSTGSAPRPIPRKPATFMVHSGLRINLPIRNQVRAAASTTPRERIVDAGVLGLPNVQEEVGSEIAPELELPGPIGLPTDRGQGFLVVADKDIDGLRVVPHQKIDVLGGEPRILSYGRWGRGPRDRARHRGGCAAHSLAQLCRYRDAVGVLLATAKYLC